MPVCDDEGKAVVHSSLIELAGVGRVDREIRDAGKGILQTVRVVVDIRDGLRRGGGEVRQRGAACKGACAD